MQPFVIPFCIVISIWLQTFAFCLTLLPDAAAVWKFFQSTMQEFYSNKFMNIPNSVNSSLGPNLSLKISPPNTYDGSDSRTSDVPFLSQDLREHVHSFDLWKRPVRSSSCGSDSNSNISDPDSDKRQGYEVPGASTDLCLANPTFNSEVPVRAALHKCTTNDCVSEWKSLNAGGRHQLQGGSCLFNRPPHPFMQDLHIRVQPKHTGGDTRPLQKKCILDDSSQLYGLYASDSQVGVGYERTLTETERNYLPSQPAPFGHCAHLSSGPPVFKELSSQESARSIEPVWHSDAASTLGLSDVQSDLTFYKDPGFPLHQNSGYQETGGHMERCTFGHQTTTWPEKLSLPPAICGTRSNLQLEDTVASIALRSRYISRLPFKRSMRTPRMRWTSSLHAHFVHAVELLGGHERMPSKSHPKLLLVLKFTFWH